MSSLTPGSDRHGVAAARGSGFRWWWDELSFRWKWRKHPEVVETINPHPAPPATVERLRQRVLSGDWTKSREEWERAYDEAMQWRDWQTCEQMIEEREQAEWWTPEEAMLDE